MSETGGPVATYRLRGGTVERELIVDGDRLATTAIRFDGSETVACESTELAVIVSTHAWRHDIPMWRWHRVTEPAGDSMAQPQLDDSEWRIVPHLHPVFDAIDDAESWFRARIPVPPATDGQRWLVIGGFDDEDWTSYAVYLDGSLLDAWESAGRLREPRRIPLRDDDPAIATLDDGRSAVLAVRVSGLARPSDKLQAGEREHYFFQGWLLDQYVAIGEPTLRIDDFVVVDHGLLTDGALIVSLRSPSVPSLTASLRYTPTGAGIRKSIDLNNSSTETITVLDVIGEDLVGHLAATGGGRGQPVMLSDSGFIGIEHPAGVNLCDEHAIRITQMPGVDLGGESSWAARTIMLGGSGSAGAAAAFREYIRDLRPRPTDRLRVYSALGWYDFTNPADPLPELTAELVTENLRQLHELRAQGAAFDVYMIDDWWEPTDLGQFRRRGFPDGGAALAAEIRAEGMEPGLWWATTRLLWTAAEAPGLSASYANDPSFGGEVALAGGTWRWLEEFGNLFIGERRLCLASEPYRSMFLEAIPSQVAALGLALLKLDCVVLHCTSSDHDHRPGRHSMEPMVDALQDLIDRCLEIRPDMRVVWYWGFRSPWYLGMGDMVFDKGLLMEAATPSSDPFPTSRQAMSLNVDQSIEHGATLPLELQDSLGVWIGDVAWCNRVGREEWREAYLLDVSRGSDLVQIWGDLTLLDASDRTFLADAQDWVHRTGEGGATTRRIGGSPWLLEPYGYLRATDDGALVTIVNPSWFASEFMLDRAAGVPAGSWTAVELYPFPGATDLADPLALAPLEVRVLRLMSSTSANGLARSTRPTVRPTRVIDTAGLGTPGGAPRGTISVGLDLPALGLGDAIYVVHRLSRDGQWAYDPEPQSRLGFEVALDGMSARFDSIPRHRDRNGPGSSWVVRRIPAGPAWSGRRLDITLRSDLPAGMSVATSACAVDEWWKRTERTFRDPMSS